MPDLVGAELSDVAKGDQGSIGRIEGREDPSQIGAGDPVGQRVGAEVRHSFQLDVGDRDLEHAWVA
jgi:hypothetical protein